MLFVCKECAFVSSGHEQGEEEKVEESHRMQYRLSWVRVFVSARGGVGEGEREEDAEFTSWMCFVSLSYTQS